MNELKHYPMTAQFSVAGPFYAIKSMDLSEYVVPFDFLAEVDAVARSTQVIEMSGSPGIYSAEPLMVNGGWTVVT